MADCSKRLERRSCATAKFNGSADCYNTARTYPPAQVTKAGARQTLATSARAAGARVLRKRSGRV